MFHLIKRNMVFLVALVVLVMACTPTQRSLISGEGFVVLPANKNHYRIEYYSRNAKKAEAYWKTTAIQLCIGSFQTLYSKLNVIQFDMYVPIAGNDVNIGRQEYIQHGEVICEAAATEVPLTQSPWQEFNRETNALKPVSETYLTELLKMYAAHLSTLPAKNASAELIRIWGKPVQQEYLDGDLLSVWSKGGDSWFPNQVILVEHDSCLKTVVILPGVSVYIASISEKLKVGAQGFSAWVASGAVPGYFYQSQAHPCLE